MLIEWLPQALKKFCRLSPKSSVPRRNSRQLRLLTAQIEGLENRALMSVTNPVTVPIDSGERVDPALLSLGSSGSTAGTGSLQPLDLIARDQAGRVGVRITTNNPAAIQPTLQSWGFVTTGSRPDLNFIEGFLPSHRLSQLSTLSASGLLGVVPSYKPVTNAGPTPNLADQVLESDRVRATLPPGFDGAGIRIGILSDSFNAGGSANLAALSNGDLPSSVQVLLEGPAGSSNEGRAMAELVHDIAPGASISFASAFISEASFAQQIRNLANPTIANADIIVDDVVYFTEPFYQDGMIAQAVNDVVKFDGVAYFSSAGNFADNAFESISPTFVPDPNILNPLAGNFLDFDPSAGVSTQNQITLGPGESLSLSLQWDDPFYTINGVDTDLDILFLDQFGQIIASATSNNIATQTPNEIIGISNNNPFQSATVTVMVRLESGPAPGRLKWVDFGSHTSNFQFDTQSPAIFGHTAAAGAMSVAASPYFDAQTIESFSSIGPTTILFSPTGSPLGAPDIRQTPDITAVDGTNTSFFTGDIFFKGLDVEKDSYPNFFGTSAAAPHAAAVAALVKQAFPGLSPTQIYDRLISTAQDIGPGGVDDSSGYGLINAYDAIFGLPSTTDINFQDSFESGVLSGFWETNEFGSGDISTISANGATDGTKSMVMDSLLSGADYLNFLQYTSPTPFFIAPNLSNGSGFLIGSLNESILRLDLTGETEDVFLSFDAKQDFNPLIPNAQTAPGTSNNLQEPMSDIFLGSEGSDGVAISSDGGLTWYKLVSLTGGQIGPDFLYHKFNLTQFANEKGIALGNDVRIKFQQFDALGSIFVSQFGNFISFFPTLVSTQSGGLQIRTNAITIDDVQVFTNEATVVILDPTDLEYEIGAPPIFIDENAVIEDLETPDFDGGSLTVVISENGSVGDRLEIESGGNLPGQISTVGNRVLFGGIEIGTFTGGGNLAPLIVVFNGNATPEIAEVLLQSITFRTADPSLLPRTIDVVVDDGNGAVSDPESRVINILPGGNVAPTITFSPNALNVTAGVTTATIIDGSATVVDPDSTFEGGSLRVVISNNSSTFDRIEIRNQGNGVGQIGVSGSAIRYSGVKIGTLSGTPSSRTIVFDPAVTPEAVQALLRNITFRSISTSSPVSARTVQFVLEDGDGNESDVAIKIVNVVKRKQPPVIRGGNSTSTYFIGKNPAIIEPSATLTDADSPNLNGGNLTVQIVQQGTTFDRLSVRNQGSNVGQIAVSGGTTVLYGGIAIGTIAGGNGASSPLVITFTANATPAAVRALMRSITFQTSGTSPSLATRSISFKVTDESGTISNTLTKGLRVRA